MFSLAIISKLNTRAEIGKARLLARAMNNPGGHAKSVEKGHRIPKKLGGVDNQRLPRISSVVH
jgi:hypothetical protein